MRASLSALEHYDRCAEAAAAQLMRHYSTSFSLATRLLQPRVRVDIRNLYAMVRTADEIVDAGLDPHDAAALLDAYETTVRNAPSQRFHADPVVHAYALSARRCGFQDEHIAEFFASMRCDLTRTSHTTESFKTYVRGSAEVIGLLCLDTFYAGAPRPDGVEEGAERLGAAFQKINFLRDLHEDSTELGRAYFPTLREPDKLDEETKAAIIADIRKDLVLARTAMDLLPLSSRVGVAAAAALFTELTDLLEATPAHKIMTTRISVPAARKAVLISRAAAHAARNKG